MAQYLVLLYEDEAGYANASEQALGEIFQAHNTFQSETGAATVGGNALQPTSTATSIRQTDSGTFEVSDGPFAEAKEALGGYYLIEAADLDAAIAIAKKVPTPFGGVEVRPIMTFD